MLIIGHRGGGGSLPENSLKALKAGFDAGADILHVDVRLTHDNVPILLHDATLFRTHKSQTTASSVDYADIQAETGSRCPPTLERILDKYLGKVVLMIELRSRGSGKVVANLLAKYVGQSSKWDTVLLSSFKVTELIAARYASKQVNLAFLHGGNPFAFITYHRFLQFSAVGFHRLHINSLALEIAKRAGIFTFAYTVDRPKAAVHLAGQGLDGIVTNYPDRIASSL